MRREKRIPGHGHYLFGVCMFSPCLWFSPGTRFPPHPKDVHVCPRCCGPSESGFGCICEWPWAGRASCPRLFPCALSYRNRFWPPTTLKWNEQVGKEFSYLFLSINLLIFLLFFVNPRLRMSHWCERTTFIDRLLHEPSPGWGGAYNQSTCPGGE